MTCGNSLTGDIVKNPPPVPTVVRQSEQKACNGDLDAGIRDHGDPCIPPSQFEKDGQEIRSNICVELGMSPDSVACQNHEQRETSDAQ